MDFVWLQMKPLHGMNYYERFFHTAQQVQQGNGPALAKFRLVGVFLSVQVVHFLYQYLRRLRSSMSPFEQIMHGDYAGVSNIIPELYLFIDCIILLTVFFMYLLYFVHRDSAVLQLLYTVLIEQRDDFFGEQHFYHGMPTCDYLRRFAVRVLNILQFFVLIIDTFVVTSQIVSMYDLFQYDPMVYSSLSGLALIVVLEVRLLWLYICLYLFAHSHILLATLWIVELKVLAIKLDALARPPSLKQLGSITYFLNRFRVQITNTLLRILSANRLFAKVLLLFMLVNCPLNGLLVCELIMGRIPRAKVVFVGPVAMEGFVFIFGIHLLSASVNKRLHRPSKQFIRLNLHNKFCKLKLRLKLHNFIVAFHTRRKYGFTYHSVGLISMFSFVKYLILYSELLMFVYKTVLK